MRRLLIILLLAMPSLSQTLPEAPSAIKFWALTAGTAAVVSYDAIQTTRPGREVSTPWLYGTYPCEHHVRLGMTMGAELAGSALLSYWMQRSHNKFVRKLWAAPLVFTMTNHTSGVVHNWKSGM